MDPERLAEIWHEVYEELAPQFGYTSRGTSPTAWSNVPEPTKSLQIAVAKRVLERLKLEAGITWTNTGLR